MTCLRRVTLLAALALWATTALARAQDPPTAPPQDEEDERSTGLPASMKWTFNFDAGWGTFGFANSLYNNPKEGVNESLSDQWFEGYVKPALSATYTLASSAEIYGKISAVGERTYGSVPPPFGSDVSSFGPEDLGIGWRSGHALDMGENAIDVSVGRLRYKLGHGFLLNDGTAEGGSRGGYWTNARQAFELAAIARIAPGRHAIETFYLDKDELEEYDTGSRLWGLNYEFKPNDRNTVGATYMRWVAHPSPDLRPGRDGLNVFNLRAYTAPLAAVSDLSFELEYAAERNADTLDSNAWTAQGAYTLSSMAWTPTLTYRYAWFEGDDPETLVDEGFDPLFPGFHDWGTWWQGEIAGEYFLSNSNLASHLVRVHVEPRDTLSGGLLLFKFSAVRPASYGPGVTDDDLAVELDAYADWEINDNFTLSLVGAFADPGSAVRQLTGRTKNFAYGMVYLAYSY